MRDLPKTEMRILDTGPFASEDKFSVIAPMIHDFLDREVGDGRRAEPTSPRRTGSPWPPRLFQFWQ